MIDLKNIMALLESAPRAFIVLVGEETAFSCSIHGTTKEIAELLLNAALKSDDFYSSMIVAVEATRRRKEKGGEE